MWEGFATVSRRISYSFRHRCRGAHPHELGQIEFSDGLQGGNCSGARVAVEKDQKPRINQLADRGASLDGRGRGNDSADANGELALADNLPLHGAF